MKIGYGRTGWNKLWRGREIEREVGQIGGNLREPGLPSCAQSRLETLHKLLECWWGVGDVGCYTDVGES